MIPVRLKAGVRVRIWDPQLNLAVMIAAGVWERHGARELVVTSGNEGRHKRASEHWGGRACDLRTHNLSAGGDALLLAQIALELRDALGSTGDFQVVVENVGEPEEHMHLEYDPQGPA